ncbi:MAG: hypothetical protein ACJATI_003261 [Halioglobus sp.]|jgi:hypothetical protein
MKQSITIFILLITFSIYGQVTVIESGDVGIKEENPKTELNVNGILSFNTNSFPPTSNGTLGLSIGVFNALPSDSWGGRVFTSSPGLSNRTGNGSLVLQGPSASGAQSGISFYTGSPSTERMVLNHAGTLILDRNLFQTFNGTSNIIIQSNNYYNSSLTGGANILMGSNSGTSLTTGSSNFLMGQYAGQNLETGKHNVFLSSSAGRYKVSGNYSVGIGPDALRNSNGSNNIGIGRITGVYQEGSHNISMGQSAGQGGTIFDQTTQTDVSTNTSSYNIWLGYQSGMSTTSGGFNIGLGQQSLFNNTSGANNVAIGRSSLKLNTSGTENIATGKDAGQKSSGSHNVFLGAFSGYSNAGSKNVYIGYEAGRTETGSNKLYIENSNSTEPLIYGDFDDDTVEIYGGLSIKTTSNMKALPLFQQEQCLQLPSLL